MSSEVDTHMKKRILALLMLALFCFCGVNEMTPARAAAKAVYISSNTLKVYKTAKTSARVLGTMGYGEKLTCTATSGSWARVKNSSGAVGYCKKAGLSTRNPNTLKKTVYINTANTRVYKLPSTSSKVLMKLRLNSAYTAVAKTGDGQWFRLQNGKHYGYVQAKYVSASKVSAAPKPAPAGKTDKIVQIAQKQAGKGYAYGAEGPSKFDCSGLTYYVYKTAAGKTLKRSSWEQTSDGRFKKITSVSAVQKGDLLCFDTGSGYADHVGVYIGGGKMVHASQSKGKVLVSELTSYWKKAFICARRIV